MLSDDSTAHTQPRNAQAGWEWSSHIPVTQAAVTQFRPEFILELGTGLFSTPIFAASGADVLCVENNPTWLSHIQSRFSTTSPHVRFYHHDLGDAIDVSTKSSALTVTQIDLLTSYYATLRSQVPQGKRTLAFVDQYTCARTISINTLLDRFDVLLFHDCEPDGIPWYGYYFDEEKCASYDLYTFKTPIVWTGMFVRRGLQYDPLILCRLCRSLSQDYALAHDLDPAALYLQRGR